MVVYEAARAIVNLKNVQSKDLSPAVSGMCCKNIGSCLLNIMQLDNLLLLQCCNYFWDRLNLI